MTRCKFPSLNLKIKTGKSRRTMNEYFVSYSVRPRVLPQNFHRCYCVNYRGGNYYGATTSVSYLCFYVSKRPLNFVITNKSREGNIASDVISLFFMSLGAPPYGKPVQHRAFCFLCYHSVLRRQLLIILNIHSGEIHTL